MQMLEPESVMSVPEVQVAQTPPEPAPHSASSSSSTVTASLSAPLDGSTSSAAPGGYVSRKHSLTAPALHAMGTVIRRISPSRNKTYSVSSEGSQSAKVAKEVSFPDMDIVDDRLSISSTGTSSTIGYRWAQVTLRQLAHVQHTGPYFAPSNLNGSIE